MALSLSSGVTSFVLCIRTEYLISKYFGKFLSKKETCSVHNSYNQFYSTVFCLLYMFRTNLVVHHQEHSIIYCITQYNRCNTVYYAVLLMMND